MRFLICYLTAIILFAIGLTVYVTTDKPKFSVHNRETTLHIKYQGHEWIIADRSVEK